MKRGTRLRHTSAKRASARPHNAAMAARVVDRDRSCIARELIGLDRCATTADPHHVWRQSKGGPWEMWNLILVCRTCHNWIHANPLLAQSLGLLVPSWTGQAGCHTAACLRELLYLTGVPAFAPWLDDLEQLETARQDHRFEGAAVFSEAGPAEG